MPDPSLYESVRRVQIGNTSILPGVTTKAGYAVGSLPSDTRVNIHIEVTRSEHPGPHVLLVAGIHGDEINGIELLRRMLAQHFFSQLLCGTVIVIPLINVYGFINFSRDVPSGKDINRSFPGTTGGSLASRVAGFISKYILPQVDVIIDCHTGAINRYNYPQVRVSREDAQSYELARAFNAPFILPKGHIRGSLRRAAHRLGKPCLIYEGGEASRLDEFTIAKGINGIQRLLASLRMIDIHFSAVPPSTEITHATWLRASASGIFTSNKHAGMPITSGEPLGVIGDPYGTKRIEVLAPKDGYIIGHSNSPVVNLGDALFHLGMK